MKTSRKFTDNIRNYLTAEETKNLIYNLNDKYDMSYESTDELSIYILLAIHNIIFS